VKIEFREMAGGLIYGGRPNFPAIMQSGTQLSLIKKHFANPPVPAKDGTPAIPGSDGTKETVGVLSLLINDFQTGFNLIRPLTDDQVVDLAIDLLTDWWAYKLEDFVSFFLLAKKSTFGRVLDRMDQDTVFKMLAEYDALRVSHLAAEQMNKQEAKDNLSPYLEADRADISRRTVDVGGAIKDFKDRVSKMPTKPKQ